MKQLKMGERTFEIVDYVPTGYTIWNIGKNMPDGYLPLCQVGGYNGCCVDVDTLKAIKIDGAQTILAAIGGGQNTIEDMERYIKRYKNSKTEITKLRVQRMIEALEVMYQLSWE